MTSNVDDTSNGAAPNGDGSDDLAPRPRPGFQSAQGARSAGDRLFSAREGNLEKAGVFAGVLRATAGCIGLFAAVLYLPITMATPVLCGVSVLMMATGSTGVWRSVRGVPSLRRLPLVVGGACVVFVAVTVAVVAVLGAGSLGPIAKAQRAAQQRALDEPATVTFER